MRNVTIERTFARGLAMSFSMPGAWRPAVSMQATSFAAAAVAPAAVAPAALAQHHGIAALTTVKTTVPTATKQYQVTTAAARTTRNGTTRNGTTRNGITRNGTTEGSSHWRSPV